MGATFKSYTSGATTASGQSLNLTLPTNMAAGDLILLSLSSESSATGATAPAGWTVGTAADAFRTKVWWKWATAQDVGATITLTNSSGNRYGVIAAVYANAVPASGVAGTTPIVRSARVSAASPISIGPISTDTDGQLVYFTGSTRDVTDAFAAWSVPASLTSRRNATATYLGYVVADTNPASAGSQGPWSWAHSGDSSSEIHAYVIAGNTPPNAPTLVAPTSSSATLDTANVNRFSWTHSDPDGQGQAAADIRYRLVGAATWTTVVYSGPNGFYDLPAGTLAPGDYEWQARTADTLGTYGPWSSSEFFAADDAPATPTITAPVNGATVDYEATVTWTAAEQAAYQLQVLDGGLVVEDSGVVEDAVARSRVVSFPDNGVQRTIRVRVRFNGLWSGWYSVEVTVSYTPPAVPVVTLTAGATSLLVQVANPTPAGAQPIVTHNRVLVDDGLDDGETVRVATLAPNGSWTYWTPRSGLDYEGRVRAVAVGENGTETTSG